VSVTTPREDLRRHARVSPERIACVDGDLRVTFAVLADAVDAWAAELTASGVRPGDRVVMLLDNSARFLGMYLATLSLGAVAVPLNPVGGTAGVTDPIRDAAPRLIVCETRMAAAVAGSFGAGGPARELAGPALGGSVSLVAPKPAEYEGLDGTGTPLAAIIYTSGSTGPPKGVMLSIANMGAIARAGCDFVDLTPDDRLGVVTPMFHLYALREVDAALRSGATLVLPKALAFPASVIQQLHRERVTGISGVPSGFLLITEGFELQLGSLAEHLRYVALGTAVAAPALLATLRSALPATRVLVTYGLTELSRACYREVTDPDERPGSVGGPYPGVELEIRGHADIAVGPAIPGRVILRSEMVMQGYWRRPDLTARTLLPDGALLTPDIGSVDEQGWLSLLGRADDVINSGGEKIGPDEVEQVLREHPAVEDAAVTGAPDPAGVLGEVVKAWIVRAPGAELDAEQVRRHCAARLEPAKVPRLVEFCGTLPKTALGKTSRALLGREG